MSKTTPLTWKGVRKMKKEPIFAMIALVLVILYGAYRAYVESKAEPVAVPDEAPAVNAPADMNKDTPLN